MRNPEELGTNVLHDFKEALLHSKNHMSLKVFVNNMINKNPYLIGLG
jgi:hypothetical protein